GRMEQKQQQQQGQEQQQQGQEQQQQGQEQQQQGQEQQIQGRRWGKGRGVMSGWWLQVRAVHAPSVRPGRVVAQRVGRGQRD
ncbi:unnamed protein product, partial [Closterium sp. NIES-54]